MSVRRVHGRGIRVRRGTRRKLRRCGRYILPFRRRDAVILVVRGAGTETAMIAFVPTPLLTARALLRLLTHRRVQGRFDLMLCTQCPTLLAVEAALHLSVWFPLCTFGFRLEK